MAQKESGRLPMGAVFELDVVLDYTDPPVRRRLLVSGDTALDPLHEILQLSMGWFNSHLHTFQRGRKTYAHPDAELDWAEDESQVRARDLLQAVGDELTYVYDMGDNWTHTVRLAAVHGRQREKECPHCIRGERACPPEDCGGIDGFYELLDILADPGHEEHESRLEWVGEDWDPDEFDLDQVNHWLRELEE